MRCKSVFLASRIDSSYILVNAVNGYTAIKCLAFEKLPSHVNLNSYYYPIFRVQIVQYTYT